MQVLRAADHKITPWKNGGGVTTQICVFPAGAGLDDFDARVSMANIASDGPFSLFGGVERTLAVLSGRGVELNGGGAAPVTLTPSTPPFSFSGDAPTQARLIDGPILDLNVMVRRGRFAHRVTRRSLETPQSLVAPAGRFLLLCAEGALRIETPGGEATLQALDAALADPAGEPLRLRPLPRAVAYVVEIAALAPSRAPGL